eukprot:TRINITY_DN2982_c0_g2_i1.p1 TRINITY_DN2982_c0_g2~~TRINITY_DN2982_c0_g2_i1.p1  ORF type:complete len:436 (-),score=108.53 TRINITY_DN2982_c0_g2_i1:13-1320(-)
MRGNSDDDLNRNSNTHDDSSYEEEDVVPSKTKTLKKHSTPVATVTEGNPFDDDDDDNDNDDNPFDTNEKIITTKKKVVDTGNPFETVDNGNPFETNVKKTITTTKKKVVDTGNPFETEGNPFDSEEEDNIQSSGNTKKPKLDDSDGDDENPFEEKKVVPFEDSPPSSKSQSKSKFAPAPPVEMELSSNWFSPDSVVVGDDVQHDELYKVIIIGDSGVGKSQFFNRWIFDTTKETKITVNIDCRAKSYQVEGKIIKIQVWDTAGQERYRALARQYYRGSHGVILMYSIVDETSFKNVQRWITDVQECTSEDCRLLLIGNKIDLDYERKVTIDEAVRLATQYNFDFLETSAQQGHNCYKAIQVILQEIHQYHQSQLKPSLNASQPSLIGKGMTLPDTPTHPLKSESRLPPISSSTTIQINSKTTDNTTEPVKGGCCN